MRSVVVCIHRATSFSLGLAVAVLAMAPPAISGTPTVKLLWDDCGLGKGMVSKTPVCDSDTGLPYKLVVSLEPDGALDNLNGAQGYIDAWFDASTLPDFWRLDTGGCRSGSLSADGLIGDANPPFSCPQPWSQVGNAGFGAALYPTVPGHSANSCRLVWIVAVPGVVTLDSATAAEWYLCALNISRAETSTCPGCETRGQFTMMETRLTRPVEDPRGDIFIYWSGQGTVTWEAPMTPTANRSWGQLKSLYR